MKVFLLSMFISSISCGYVIDVTSYARARELKFARQPVSDSKTIQTIPNRGEFIVQIVPFTYIGEGITYWAELLWKPQRSEPIFVELLMIKWPGATFKVSEIESSIKPQSIDVKQTITVKYERENDCIMQKYKYDYRNVKYTSQGTLKNC